MYVCKQDKRTKRRESRRLRKRNIYHTKEATTQGKLILRREQEGGAILRGITWINKGNTVIPGKAVKKVRLYINPSRKLSLSLRQNGKKERVKQILQ